MSSANTARWGIGAPPGWRRAGRRVRYVPGVDDLEVIEAFVGHGARKAFGPTLHIEGDGLLLDGWWHSAFRVSSDTFTVRNEEPPGDSRVLQDMAAALARRGLQDVGVDLPLIQPVTYAALSLGSVSWTLWAPDLSTGDRALAERAGAESFFEETSQEGPAVDFDAEHGGAWRVAGLPPSLILTVGVDADVEAALEPAFPDCRFESRTFENLSPDACGSLIPTVIVVDATTQPGKEFVMELRASACGRFTPVAAVTEGEGVPLGADIALERGQDTAQWVGPIRALLP